MHLLEQAIQIGEALIDGRPSFVDADVAGGQAIRRMETQGGTHFQRTVGLYIPLVVLGATQEYQSTGRVALLVGRDKLLKYFL